MRPIASHAPERPVVQGFAVDTFRTALSHAARATGVPMFSPDVGHGDLVTTARKHTHVVAGETQLGSAAVLR